MTQALSLRAAIIALTGLCLVAACTKEALPPELVDIEIPDATITVIGNAEDSIPHSRYVPSDTTDGVFRANLSDSLRYTMSIIPFDRYTDTTPNTATLVGVSYYYVEGLGFIPRREVWLSFIPLAEGRYALQREYNRSSRAPRFVQNILVADGDALADSYSDVAPGTDAYVEVLSYDADTRIITGTLSATLLRARTGPSDPPGLPERITFKDVQFWGRVPE